MPWAKHLFEAFISGAHILHWTMDTLYWVAKPKVLLDDNRRLHRETGPAVVSDCEDLYFWHGTIVPAEWIEDRASLTAKTALTWQNTEQRRAACEIVGWANILVELDAKTIDKDIDPQIGEVVEVELEGARERFLRVICGTGREFAIPIPPDTETSLAAQAWLRGIEVEKFIKPVRT